MRVFRPLMRCTAAPCLSSELALVPRRSVLYVPGNSAKMIHKAQSINADCVVLDCEDGVSATAKDSARTLIAETLSSHTDFGSSDVAVRINSICSGLAEKDLDVLLNIVNPPKTIVVPKLDTVEQVEWLGQKLEFNGARSVGVNLIAMMESPESLLNLQQICKEASSAMGRVCGHLVAVIFGSDDFCASIGATRSPAGTELLYARQKLVAVCKRFKIQAIDMVHIDYKDLDGLRTYSNEGAAMGFTGKQVIHPAQVPVVQDCFSPSPEKITWAQELSEAFEQHKNEGKGAFVFRNQMIDKPLLLQAENICSIAKVIRQRDGNQNN